VAKKYIIAKKVIDVLRMAHEDVSKLIPEILEGAPIVDQQNSLPLLILINGLQQTMLDIDRLSLNMEFYNALQYESDGLSGVH